MVDWKLVVPVLDDWKNVLGEHPFTLDEFADVVFAVATDPHRPSKDGSELLSDAIQQCIQAVLSRSEYNSWFDAVVGRIATFNQQRQIYEMNQEETNLIMQWERPTAARVNRQHEQQPTSAAETVISSAVAVSMVYPAVDEQLLRSSAKETVIIEHPSEHEQQEAAHLCADHVFISAVGVVAALILAFVLDSSGFADSGSAPDAVATAAAIRQTIDSSAVCCSTQQQQNAAHLAAVSAYAVATSTTTSSVAAFPYDPGGRHRVFDPGGHSCSLLLIGDTFHAESVAGSQLSTQRHQLPSHALSWARKDPTDTAETSSRGMSLVVNRYQPAAAGFPSPSLLSQPISNTSYGKEFR